MQTLKQLLDNNRAWARRMQHDDPQFFEGLERQQTPPYLWIGCSDSRVPANQIIGLPPGEVFVHRNVANLVGNTDFNCLSVLQYAVEVLKVRHIIVCGHYGCGGVAAALADEPLGLIDNWVRQIRDVYDLSELARSTEPRPAKLERLCELNVVAQVRNVCHTTVVREAWRRGQAVDVHGWIYSLRDGLLKDLGLGVSSPDEAASIDRMLWPNRAH